MSEQPDKFAESLEYLDELIRRDVAAGFREVDDILESAVECAGDGLPDPDVLTPIARSLLRDALIEHYGEQALWPDRTDCDRLDEAFADLEAGGVVARQDFTCCSTCGHAEIGAEIDDAEEDGLTVTGYAFYHQQDTEGAVGGGGVYVKYGALSADPERNTEVGRRVVAAVEAAGLTATWDGTPESAVHVALTWRKRRPADEFPSE